MTLEELKSLKDMCEILDTYGSYQDSRLNYKNQKEYFNESDEGVVIELVDSLISKYGWKIMADDTHRWCESDGFYEVEFHLHTEAGEVYINTESGGQDLEDEWSDNNPQEISDIRDCYLRDAFDWKCFIQELIDTFEKQSKN